MSDLRDLMEWCGTDIVRAIIEVTNEHGGRTGFDVVASGLKDAAHCPEFDGDGLSALNLFMKEYSSLMDAMDVYFDDETKEFWVLQ